MRVTNAPASRKRRKRMLQLAKGYRHMVAGGASTIPQALPETPTEIQCVLLNPVEEDECERLLDDAVWAAQPKLDGVRFMLGRKDGKVYALNRKGKTVGRNKQTGEFTRFSTEDFAFATDGMAMDFPFARSLVVVRSRRTEKRSGKSTEETRYYISSLEPEGRPPHPWHQ